ncbi:hypothetical protein STRDD11_00106 [Streptococcus sp. DD11]|nr:hypothetical protein STRDD11_00106 [Streptococcus sp. DD11]
MPGQRQERFLIKKILSGFQRSESGTTIGQTESSILSE